MTIVRPRQRRAAEARAAGTLRGADRSAAGPARRALPAHARARRLHRRRGRPADARARQPRDRAGRERRRWCSSATGSATTSTTGDCVTFDADLPHHFENPAGEPAVFLAVLSAGAEKELRCRRPCSRRSGRPTSSTAGAALHRPAPRPRGDEPAGVRRPAAGGPRVRRPDRTLATADHNTPTDGTPAAALIRTSSRGCRSRRSSATARSSGSRSTRWAPTRQGIVHVIGPELGVTQPGMTIVCGDSHTSTHGAFGALAFGIGTSEVEHVLATQCLVQPRPRSMRVRYERRARLRRDRQGPDPRDARATRRRRLQRPRRGVRRPADPRRSRWKAA